MAAGKKGSRKIGRDKDKCNAYRLHNTRAKNKLKRVLRSNSFSDAQKYASLHGLPVPKEP